MHRLSQRSASRFLFTHTLKQRGKAYRRTAGRHRGKRHGELNEELSKQQVQVMSQLFTTA